MDVHWEINADHGGTVDIQLDATGTGNYQTVIQGVDRKGPNGENEVTVQVTFPESSAGVANAQVKWVWDSVREGGFYFGCADVDVRASAGTAKANVPGASVGSFGKAEWKQKMGTMLGVAPEYVLISKVVPGAEPNTVDVDYTFNYGAAIEPSALMSKVSAATTNELAAVGLAGQKHIDNGDGGGGSNGGAVAAGVIISLLVVAALCGAFYYDRTHDGALRKKLTGSGGSSTPADASSRAEVIRQALLPPSPSSLHPCRAARRGCPCLLPLAVHLSVAHRRYPT